MTTHDGQGNMNSKKSSRRWPRADVIAAVGVLVAIVGILVPVLDVRLPVGGGGRSDESAPAAAPTTSTTTPDAHQTSEPPVLADERRLTTLKPAEGAGLIKEVPPRDLEIPCGTNQSDDRSRQVVYQLPAAYQRFAATATATGPADPESLVQVSVFVHDRYDRSDRERQVARETGRLTERLPLAADIAGARALTIHIQCQSPAMVVRFADPRVSR
jgi:hypothetical protein